MLYIIAALLYFTKEPAKEEVRPEPKAPEPEPEPMSEESEESDVGRYNIKLNDSIKSLSNWLAILCHV